MLKGYIGLTDPGWYKYLASLPKVEEVNFWQPHGVRKFKVLERGEIFFFKLRAPYRAIAGFGFFERYESMPAWLAWDCFGNMNGAPEQKTMIEQIAALRGETGAAIMAGEFEIGCVVITAPFFFRESEWIEPPADWARTGIQQGKAYDLLVGEGQRIYRQCLETAQNSSRFWNVEPKIAKVGDEEERFGSPLLVRPRLGQGGFSLAVRDAYEGACAVTHEHSLPVLDAAHIRPYSLGGQHLVENGILLRRDLHRLFDRGYVTVTPDYVFRVGERLRDEFKNGRSYYGLADTEIAVPKKDLWRPNKELLDWHAREVFKG